MAGGCTALIKRSLVFDAYEKLLKELQTAEIWKGIDIKTSVFSQICSKNVYFTISVLFERLLVYINWVGAGSC